MKIELRPICALLEIFHDMKYAFKISRLISYLKRHRGTIWDLGLCDQQSFTVLSTLYCIRHRTLYTGDFRLELADLRGMPALHGEDGDVLPIHSLHIDSTFCAKEIRYFPSRAESADELYNLVHPWLAADEQRLVYLEAPANFGHEFLLVELARRIHLVRTYFLNE